MTPNILYGDQVTNKAAIIQIKTIPANVKKVMKQSNLFVKKVTLPAIACSKFTIETLKQGAKYVKICVVLVSLLLTLNIFHTFF